MAGLLSPARAVIRRSESDLHTPTGGHSFGLPSSAAEALTSAGSVIGPARLQIQSPSPSANETAPAASVHLPDELHARVPLRSDDISSCVPAHRLTSTKTRSLPRSSSPRARRAATAYRAASTRSARGPARASAAGL